MSHAAADDPNGDFRQFTTEQRIWLVEREVQVLTTKLAGLEGVLNRILWALITLVVTVLGSVVTMLVINSGGGA